MKSEIQNPRSEIANPQSELEEVGRILEERALALARLRRDEEPEEETLYLMTFPLGEERYALEITAVKEVHPLGQQNWSPVPCTPDFIVGAVNIRGRIYSVMDVGYFLGLPPRSPSEKAHVLLVHGGVEGDGDEIELCVLIDDVAQVARVPLTEVQPAPVAVSNQSQDYVRGVTEEMLIILDLGRLLSDPRIIVHEEV